MRDYFDYAIKDSTHNKDADSWSLFNARDNAILIGIIREERETEEGETRYVVEVQRGGRQIPLSCTWMTRFGGAHNFEEYRLRPWTRSPAIASNAGPNSASTLDLRAGDRVVVAPLDGQWREGIILGGVTHPARGESTERGTMAYHSSYQGLETKIDDDGTYTVTFNGKALNFLQLEIPPTGSPVPAPEYNSQVAGSYFQFDNLGSYTVAVNESNLIKLKKQTGNIVIVSGDRRIEIGEADPFGLLSAGISIKSDVIKAEADEITISSGKTLIQGTDEATLAGTKVAIGNPAMELLDTISKLVDAIGKVTVTSPVGTCTPVMASPQWAEVLALKTLIDQSKGSISPPMPVFIA